MATPFLAEIRLLRQIVSSNRKQLNDKAIKQVQPELYALKNEQIDVFTRLADELEQGVVTRIPAGASLTA